MIFVGIDPSAGERNPSGICFMDKSFRIILINKWWTLNDLDAILKPLSNRIRFIGIDGPLQPPHELDYCCFKDSVLPCHHKQTTPFKGRYCEKILNQFGFRCFVTSKNSFAKIWIKRCFEIDHHLRSEGYLTLEVYPTAVRKILFPELKGKKKSLNFRKHLQKLIEESGIQIPQNKRVYSDDELDAVLAAYTVVLHEQKKTIVIGDEKDGFIILPKTEKIPIQYVKPHFL